MSDRILLAHGSGGRMAHDIIRNSFLPMLSNPVLTKLDDSALIEPAGRLAFTTDSYVVQPIFFPGGDIGRLAVCGTVNDLAMAGATPLYLSLSFIIEEGLLLGDLEKVVNSIKEATMAAGVAVVTGDTKVVNRGTADKLFINTAGIGTVAAGVDISGHNARPGDMLILSGTVGDHGIAVLSQREGINFATELKSDCAPLNGLVAEMLASSLNIHCLRDPTRGGLATTLNEIAEQSGVSIRIYEEKIPVREAVSSACEMLGLDPLYVANEGKLVAAVSPGDAEKVLERMKRHQYGRDAAIIGEVKEENPGRVVMKTGLGTTRIVDMLVGEPLPRIC
ncbi:MAG: hydrogenase expression/formation protein HypE [Dehalococcoidales bacterium]|nr:hydrogenase expression/formation protein HypE [Dehalococcoidales bacterium]